MKTTAVSLVLISAVMHAVRNFLTRTAHDKQAVTHFHPVAFAFIDPWFSILLLSGYITTTKQKGALRREWQRKRRSIMACGVLGFSATF